MPNTEEGSIVVQLQVGLPEILAQLGVMKGAALAITEITRHYDDQTFPNRAEVPKALLRDWATTILALSAHNSELAAQVPRRPDFAAVLDMRQSDMSEQQKADALEGWMRDHVDSFSDYYRDKVEFLFKRLDEARGIE